MKLGIRGHDLGQTSALELGKRLKEHGFSAIQLVIHKALENMTGEAGTLNAEIAQSISKDFEKNEIEIALLGAYFNPIHSNKELTKNAILKFKEHLKYARDFHCCYVASETGSYNDDKWTYHPDNHNDETFWQVAEIFKDLTKVAKENNSVVLVEGAYAHVVHSPKRLKEMLDWIDSNHIQVIVDVFNFLNLDNHLNHVEILKECIQLFGDKIKIFHLKDYNKVDQKLKKCALGKGIMNYKEMIPLMKKHCPDAVLVFEGVVGEEIIPSVNFINSLLKI